MASVGRQDLLSKPVAPVAILNYSRPYGIILTGSDSPKRLSNHTPACGPKIPERAVFPWLKIPDRFHHAQF